MAQPSKMLAVWESLGNEEGFSMSMSEVPAPVALIQMMTGYWIAKSIYIAAELGIADLLQDGPETSEELAVACGAHGASVYRLLRGLASVGIFQEIDGKRFTLTPTAALLQSDVPGSMRALARMYGGAQYQAWGEALTASRAVNRPSITFMARPTSTTSLRTPRPRPSSTMR